MANTSILNIQWIRINSSPGPAPPYHPAHCCIPHHRLLLTALPTHGARPLPPLPTFTRTISRAWRGETPAAHAPYTLLQHPVRVAAHRLPTTYLQKRMVACLCFGRILLARTSTTPRYISPPSPSTRAPPSSHPFCLISTNYRTPAWAFSWFAVVGRLPLLNIHDYLRPCASAPHPTPMHSPTPPPPPPAPPTPPHHAPHTPSPTAHTGWFPTFAHTNQRATRRHPARFRVPGGHYCCEPRCRRPIRARLATAIAYSVPANTRMTATPPPPPNRGTFLPNQPGVRDSISGHRLQTAAPHHAAAEEATPFTRLSEGLTAACIGTLLMGTGILRRASA